MVRRTRESGNASLAFIMLGATALLGVLTQTQGVVSNRMKASQVKKINLEGHESGLYALSVARQMVNKDSSPLPSFGFKNPTDPASVQDIALKPLETNPNPPAVSLAADGSLMVSAPDLVKLTSAQMDQLFQTKNFNINQKLTQVQVKPFAWDPFPSGYGIQTIYLEATAQLTQNEIKSMLKTRAKVPVPAPDGSCIITATANGSPIANGATLPIGTQVLVNLHCKGVVLHASLRDLGVLLAEAGPVTAARDYNSDVPRTLTPTTIASAGNHDLQADVRLVDGSNTPVANLTFSIQSNSNPLVCRSKCTCVSWGAGNDCLGTTPFADPFPGWTGPLPAPLPTLTANPNNDPSQLARLDTWAQTHNMYKPGAYWQGASFPNYPNVLVCAKVTAGFDLYTFDPANNCAENKVSGRSQLGCLREGSQITIAPNQTARIETLRPGDRIWNPLTRSFRIITKVVAGPEPKELISLRTDEHNLTVTVTHPMRTPAGYVQASQLQSGDLLLIDGRWLPLRNIQADAAGQTVWNLELQSSSDDDQLAFEAEGIIVGDLSLQKRLERKSSHHEP